jgi:murein DD-endopeptidase MepM/ murein hydrolase activator NlpD
MLLLEMKTVHSCFRIGLVCALLAAVPAARGSAANALLPANDFCQTSAFGSWRFGHLHAGIDLSTGGVEGAPVAAIDSCWVWRVSVRNDGYGRAIYVRLPDGRIAVYGHLSAFAPRIEEAVEREQDLRGSYSVDIYNDPYAVTFKKGEIIGFSGASGWGPPHLHFEVRSGMYDHYKIDPFPRYIECADTRPPVINSLRAVPIGIGSSVNGDLIPVALDAGGGGDTLMISGDFGVMVSAYDYTGCGRVTTPVVYEALVDGEPVWSLDLSKFPFGKTNFVWSLYDFDEAGRRYVRLFNPFRLDFHGFDISHADTAYGGFEPGLHDLTVRVADDCGNEARMSVPFLYGEFPAFERFVAERESSLVHFEVGVSPGNAAVEMRYSVAGSPWIMSGEQQITGTGKHEFTFPAGPRAVDVRCRISGGSGLSREGVFRIPALAPSPPEPDLSLSVNGRGIEITARSAEAPSELPVASVFEGIHIEKIPLQPAGEGIFRGIYRPRCQGDAVQARVVFKYGGTEAAAVSGSPLACLERASSAVILTEKFKLRIEVPRDMRPGVLLGCVEGAPVAYEGFTDSLGSLIFQPPGTFFVEKARVCLALREGSMTVKQGVFADRGDQVSFRARADSSGVACFETDFLEKLVVLEDRLPPEIKDFEGRGRREDGKYIFTARASDAGSGVDPETLAAFVDGEVAIAGLDPDTGIITARTTKRLREGSHRFTLEIKDRMGNRVSTENILTLH